MNAPRKRRTAPLSATMVHVLRLAADEQRLYTGVQGRAETAGRGQTISALLKRGYIDRDHRLTRAGLHALAMASKGEK